MSRTFRQVCAAVALITIGAAGAGAGLLTASAIAADGEDPRLILGNMQDGKNIAVGKGEDAAALEKAAQSKFKAYEDDATVGGHGAPQKLLLENEVVRVTLVAFKKGFKRSGGMKRKYHQMLVYVDQGAYSLTRSASNPDPNATPIPNRLAPGSIVFHRAHSVISDTIIDQDYRVLFVDMKK